MKDVTTSTVEEMVLDIVGFIDYDLKKEIEQELREEGFSEELYEITDRTIHWLETFGVEVDP